MKSAIPHLRKNAALGVFCVLFLFINIITLNDGHNWGDDFAQYIHHARNIVEHKAYDAPLMLEEWVTVPPGFPLLIAPIIKLFGLNFPILKFMNILYWLLATLGVYALAKRYTSRPAALMIALVLLSSPRFFTFKQNVLADIPFSLFVVATVYAVMRFEDSPLREKPALKMFWLASIFFFSGYAFLIRNAGVILFLALAIHFMIYRRSLRLIAGLAAALAGIWLMQQSLGVAPAQYYERLNISFSQWAHLLIKNISSPFTLMYQFFTPDLFGLWPKLDRLVTGLVKGAAPLILLAMAAVFIYKIKKKTLAFWENFLILFLFLMPFWPIPDGRYVYPIVGFALMAMIRAAEGIELILKRISGRIPFHAQKCARSVLLILFILNVATTGMLFNFNDNMIYQSEPLAVMRWMTTHMKSDEHFMFHKPRALGLLTGRMGTPLWMHSKDKNNMAGRIRKFDIDYLIIIKQFDRPLIDQLEPAGVTVHSVWESPTYQIFKVLEL